MASLLKKEKKANTLTFHKAKVKMARTNNPRSIASIITHNGIEKETFGVAQITDVLIWNGKIKEMSLNLKTIQWNKTVTYQYNIGGSGYFWKDPYINWSHPGGRFERLQHLNLEF